MKPQDLGYRIRQAREMRGLTQEQFAERIERDQRSVSEYESGKRRIYAHDLPTIARALELPLTYFFQDVWSEDDLDTVLLEQFHRLNLSARKTLLEMTRLLIELQTTKE